MSAIKKRGANVSPFTIIPGSGETTSFYVNYHGREGLGIMGHHLMSPYTRFVPVEYLRNGMIGGIGNPFRATFIESNAETTRLIVNKYLFFNKPCGFKRHGSTHMRIDRLQYATTDTTYWYSNFIARHYSCTAYPFSLFIMNQDTTKWIPCAVMVVPRENLLKVKMELLLKGRCDMSNFVYLVDNEIDSTAYWNPSFRTMFKKQFEPFIKGMGVTICKVPANYIEENCFVQEAKIESKNIFDRKKEIEELKEEYIRYLKGGINPPSQEAPEVVRLGGEIIYDSEGTTTWTYAGTGAYITGVDPINVDAAGSTLTVNYDTLAQGLRTQGSPGIMEQMGAQQVMYNTVINQISQSMREEIGIDRGRLGEVQERRIMPIPANEAARELLGEAIREQGMQVRAEIEQQAIATQE